MENNTQERSVESTFKDKDGNPIMVHSYVKDGNGRLYFINSHLQAVPDGEDAPAVELKQLAESSEITLMSAADVLNHRKAMQERPHRRGRARKAEAGKEAQQKDDGEEGKPAEQTAPLRDKEDLLPATLELVLTAIPDDALAAELRKRGYTLCAVKPALITL